MYATVKVQAYVPTTEPTISVDYLYNESEVHQQSVHKLKSWNK